MKFMKLFSQFTWQYLFNCYYFISRKRCIYKGGNVGRIPDTFPDICAIFGHSVHVGVGLYITNIAWY